LFELIRGGNLVVYSDDAMRLAISRTVADETPRGWRISKEKQSHKIDVVVALAMACHAAVQGQAEPYFTNYNAWMDDDGDWQALRTKLYLQSGGTFIL
jgi:phage terminase large subunit-like protein